MATRMQQRRGTASQWTTANPVLAAGEIGFETDTNQFKIGDGINTWTNLSYFIDSSSISGSLGDYVELASLGVADGVATLDSTGNVPSSQLGNVPTVDLTGYATETYVNTAVNSLIDSAPAALDTLNELAAALGDDANFATTVTTAIAGKADSVHTHVLTDVTDVTASAAALNTIDNGTAGYTALSNGTAGISYQPVSHNYIINGAFDVWQRGTSVGCPSSVITYTSDRWFVRPNSSTGTNVSRSTDAPTGFSYSALITRDAGQTGTFLRFEHPFETSTIASLRSQVVTLSFWAKKDSGFTGTTVPVLLFTGNGTERARAITGYDNEAAPINTSFTPTTSWQRFTFTSSALASDVSQMAFQINYIGSGTAPSNDGIFITGVQLEAGSVATPFKRHAPSLQGELAACQRYYFRTTPGNNENLGIGNVATTTNVRVMGFFPVPMRIAPTAVEQSGIASDYAVNIAGVTTICTTVPTFLTATTDTIYDVIFIASGFIPGQAGRGITASATAYLGWSAEL